MPPRYRAENVGSFLRPPDLLKSRAAFAQGQIKDTSKDPVGGATGGGKMSGEGAAGLQGPVPPKGVQGLQRLATKQAEIRNTASSQIYSTEKSLKEVGDKAEAGVRADVESALAELKRVSDNGTAAEIKAASEKLEQASFKLAETLYKATGGTADGATDGAAGTHAEGSTNGHGAPQDDVIDAEFKEAK